MLPYYRLAEAVKHGCMQEIHDAIAAGAPLEKPDITSLPLLELAQKHGQLEAARLLLKFGADPRETTSRNGDTLIHKAIRSGQSAFVSLWIENGVDPKQLNDCGEAAIHLAARHGQQYVVDQLRESGVSVFQEDASGRTPIMYAAEAGQTAVAKHLIAIGVDPLFPDATGCNAFQVAAKNRHGACCKAMLDNANLYAEEKDRLFKRLSSITKKFGYEDATAWLAAEAGSDHRPSSLSTIDKSVSPTKDYHIG